MLVAAKLARGRLRRSVTFHREQLADPTVILVYVSLGSARPKEGTDAAKALEDFCPLRVFTIEWTLSKFHW